MMIACQARQYGTEISCARCGTRWESGDPDPPPCAPAGDRPRMLVQSTHAAPVDNLARVKCMEALQRLKGNQWTEHL